MFGNLTPMVRNLLLINVGVFLIENIMGANFSLQFGLKYFNSPQFQPYQLVTHIFLHGSFGHLLGNMFGLFIFGPMLERLWGSDRFLKFYLITGLGASLLFSGVHYLEIRPMEQAAESYAEHPGPDAFEIFLSEYAKDLYEANMDFIEKFHEKPNDRGMIESSRRAVQNIYLGMANFSMVGASGAVFGILMAFGYLFPNLTLMLIIPPIPIKAKYLVLFLGLYALYAGIKQAPGDNIAHFAHLGGMIFAFVLLKVWGYKPNSY